MVDTRSLDDVLAPATSPLAGLRVAYAPLSPSLEQPGDRRGFAWYAARRGLAGWWRASRAP
jgi:hypothetical protein